MKKVDYVVSIVEAVKEATKNEIKTIKVSKDMISAAAKEVLGFTFEKASNLASDLVMARKSEIEKVAKRLTVAQLEMLLTALAPVVSTEEMEEEEIGMKEWYVKMKLSGVDMNIPVVAKDRERAKEQAIKFCIKSGYIGGKVLNVRRVTT